MGLLFVFAYANAGVTPLSANGHVLFTWTLRSRLRRHGVSLQLEADSYFQDRSVPREICDTVHNRCQLGGTPVADRAESGEVKVQFMRRVNAPA